MLCSSVKTSPPYHTSHLTMAHVPLLTVKRGCVPPHQARTHHPSSLPSLHEQGQGLTPHLANLPERIHDPIIWLLIRSVLPLACRKPCPCLASLPGSRQSGPLDHLIQPPISHAILHTYLPAHHPAPCPTQQDGHWSWMDGWMDGWMGHTMPCHVRPCGITNLPVFR